MKTRRSRILATAAASLMAAAMFVAPSADAANAPADHSPAATAQAATAVENADVPGTAWAVDPGTHTLEITADSTVDAAELTELRRATAGLGNAVSIERSPGTLRPYVSGGSSVYGDSARCTAGFNVHNGSTYYFLTAGHCTNVTGSWYADSARTIFIGPTVGSSFPGNDYGLVRYDNPSVPHPSDVRNALRVVTQITKAGNSSVGQEVCTTNDMTTAVHCGTVTALNATVNYGGGDIVSGMAQTNLCSESGASGSPVFSGTTALGIISGGSGSCSSGGTTYYQPITEALSAYGVTV